MPFPPKVVQLPVLFIDVADTLDMSIYGVGAPAKYPLESMVDPTTYKTPGTFAAKMMGESVMNADIKQLGIPSGPQLSPSLESQLDDLAMYVAAFVGRYKRHAYCIVNVQRSGIQHPNYPSGTALHAISLFFYPNGKVEFFDVRGYEGPFGGLRVPERREVPGWQPLDYYDSQRFEGFLKRFVNIRLGEVVEGLEPSLKLRMQKWSRGICYRTLVTAQLASDRARRGASMNDCRYATVLYTYLRATHPRMQQKSVIAEFVKLYPEDEDRFKGCLRKIEARKRKKAKKGKAGKTGKAKTSGKAGKAKKVKKAKGKGGEPSKRKRSGR